MGTQWRSCCAHRDEKSNYKPSVAHCPFLARSRETVKRIFVTTILPVKWINIASYSRPLGLVCNHLFIYRLCFIHKWIPCWVEFVPRSVCMQYDETGLEICLNSVHPSRLTGNTGCEIIKLGVNIWQCTMRNLWPTKAAWQIKGLWIILKKKTKQINKCLFARHRSQWLSPRCLFHPRCCFALGLQCCASLYTL